MAHVKAGSKPAYFPHFLFFKLSSCCERNLHYTEMLRIPAHMINRQGGSFPDAMFEPVLDGYWAFFWCLK